MLYFAIIPRPIEQPIAATSAGSRWRAADDKVGGQHPTEVVEDVLHEHAAPDKTESPQRRQPLGAAASTKLACHKSCQHHGNGLRDRRKKTEAHQRSSEECQGDTGKERCDRRVSNVAPGQMTRVVESGKFVAMETVASTGKEVDNYCCGRQINQDGKIRKPGRRSRRLARVRCQCHARHNNSLTPRCEMCNAYVDGIGMGAL